MTWFRQYYLGCLSHASYLIGDAETKTAAVVDPQRDVQQYLTDAADAGLEIRHVLLTHFHADFVAGHLEMQAATGATIHLGRTANADFEYEPMGDGDVLHLGRIRLVWLETPGHTPESVSILVYGPTGGEDAPYAVLTGDTLFIGDVGRPDLMASSGVSAGELAGMLYDSLHEKLLPLPDATLVYPAHGAGSLCGKNLSSETVSTMGDQRLTNYALQPMSRREFVLLATEDLPPQPEYFAHAAGYNRSHRETLDTVLGRSMKPLTLSEVVERQARGEQILDVRSPDSFAGRHLEGSVNVGLAGRYASWAGTVLDRDSDIVLIADPGQEDEAAMRLGRIGYDHVAGYLEGGPTAFAPGHPKVRTVERLAPPALAREMDSDDPPVILDVRNPGELEVSRIDGSTHIPLGELTGRHAELPRDRRVVIHCAGGYRSMIAASLLEPHGFEDLADLAGGMAAWRAWNGDGEVGCSTTSCDTA